MGSPNSPKVVTEGDSCDEYKIEGHQRPLHQGEAVIIEYNVPADGESMIELILNTAGYGGKEKTDIYVCKDCNPKYSDCRPLQYLNSAGTIQISSPVSGSTYYIMVYARYGVFAFALTMKSYKCPISSLVNNDELSKKEVDIQLPSANFVELVD